MGRVLYELVRADLIDLIYQLNSRSTFLHSWSSHNLLHYHFFHLSWLRALFEIFLYCFLVLLLHLKIKSSTTCLFARNPSRPVFQSCTAGFEITILAGFFECPIITGAGCFAYSCTGLPIGFIASSNITSSKRNTLVRTILTVTSPGSISSFRASVCTRNTTWLFLQSTIRVFHETLFVWCSKGPEFASWVYTAYSSTSFPISCINFANVVSFKVNGLFRTCVASTIHHGQWQTWYNQ